MYNTYSIFRIVIRSILRFRNVETKQQSLFNMILTYLKNNYAFVKKKKLTLDVIYNILKLIWQKNSFFSVSNFLLHYWTFLWFFLFTELFLIPKCLYVTHLFSNGKGGVRIVLYLNVTVFKRGIWIILRLFFTILLNYKNSSII